MKDIVLIRKLRSCQNYFEKLCFENICAIREQICGVKSLKHKQTIKKETSFIRHMLPSRAEINIYLHEAEYIFPEMDSGLHMTGSMNA